MSKSNGDLFIQYGSGSYIYLPRYVKTFRKVEADTIKYLDGINAQEIMLPKLLHNENVESLKCCDYRFEEEWNKEQLLVTNSRNENVGLLAHWQCEPIYLYLSEIFDNVSGDQDLRIVFDNSGYSYRLEENNDIYRPNEFRRVEVFFHGNILSVRRAIHNILDFFVKYLEGFDAIRLQRPEESFGGKEEVEDVAVLISGKEIEVIGSHIHFDTFSSISTAKLDKRVVTACCGISLSRLSSIITINGTTANKENSLGRQKAPLVPRSAFAAGDF